MTSLSAVIITFNEERNIERCIRSLGKVADDIVVLDSFSQDKTQTICEQLTAEFPVRFFQKEWINYSVNKNHLNKLAKYDYLLSIDADEALDEQLEKEILQRKQGGLSGAYRVNRLTNYCGKWIKHSGWYPDIKTRIFSRKDAEWAGEYVHETLEFKKSVTEQLLPGHLLHYSYYSGEDHRSRADRYSALTAKKMHAKGKKASLLKPYLSALARFVSMYIFKLGILDGVMGFRIARISAASNIFKYKELRRLNKTGNI